MSIQPRDAVKGIEKWKWDTKEKNRRGNRRKLYFVICRTNRTVFLYRKHSKFYTFDYLYYVRRNTYAIL